MASNPVTYEKTSRDVLDMLARLGLDFPRQLTPDKAYVGGLIDRYNLARGALVDVELGKFVERALAAAKAGESQPLADRKTMLAHEDPVATADDHGGREGQPPAQPSARLILGPSDPREDRPSICASSTWR